MMRMCVSMKTGEHLFSDRLHYMVFGEVIVPAKQQSVQVENYNHIRSNEQEVD